MFLRGGDVIQAHLVVVDGCILHHEGELLRRCELDAAEDPGVLPPLPGVREQLDLHALARGVQGPVAEPAVAHTDGEVEGIDLLARHEVLGCQEPGARGVHDAQGHGWAVLALGDEPVLEVHGLVLVVAVPLEVAHLGLLARVKDLGDPAVDLQAGQHTDHPEVGARRVDLAEADAPVVDRHDPGRGDLHEAGAAPVRGAGEGFVAGVSRRAEQDCKEPYERKDPVHA